MQREIVEINSPNLLPKRTYGPFDHEQMQKVIIPGRVFRLFRKYPRPYYEYYVEPESTPVKDRE